jgi:uncharacterized protein YyaL (SSP411 family)
VEGLIALYQATGEKFWMDKSIVFTEIMLEQFWDEKGAGFYLTGRDHEKLIARVKDVYDNAMPAGSSVAVFNLLKLALLSGNQTYRDRAKANLERMTAPLARYPGGFGYLLGAADFHLGPVREIVVVGNKKDPQTRNLLAAVFGQYLPNKVVALLDPENQGLATLPLLEGKSLVHGRPAVYVCQNYTCKAPVTDVAELEGSLRK